MMLKIFTLLFLLLLSVDAFVLGRIIDSTILTVIGVVLFLSMGVFLITPIRSYLKTKNKPMTGWSIGPGLELSNPVNPKKCHVTLQQKAMDLGFLGIGAPGSGKTVSIGVGYIQYNVKQNANRGWSIIDGKGDIDYYLNLVMAGATPDYFLSSELPGSNTINIFSGDAMDVVDRCSRFLVPTTTSTSYYSDEQKTALLTVIPLLKHMPMASSLRDLYTVLTVEEAGMDLLTVARSVDTVPETDLELAKKWFDTPHDERFALNKGLINRLHTFCAGAHTDRFNAYQPDIDISECMANGKSIFFHLPYAEFSKDIAIAIVEMFGVEARRRQLAGPEHSEAYPLLFEDYGGFFHSNFGPISSRCRSAKMPLSFTFQSLAQLNKVDHTFLDELDDNLPTKIIFRVMGGNTVDFAIKLLDEYDTRELSNTEMNGRSGSNMHAGKQARLTTREIRELNAGEAFVSTLLYDGANVSNPLYRVQFPNLKLDSSLNAALPGSQTFDEGEGIGLWSKYMSPSRLREIQQNMQDALLNDSVEEIA